MILLNMTRGLNLFYYLNRRMNVILNYFVSWIYFNVSFVLEYLGLTLNVMAFMNYQEFMNQRDKLFSEKIKLKIYSGLVD
jgi:hypothetical protein